MIPHCISSDQSEILAQANSSKSLALARSALQQFESQMLQCQHPCHVHPPVKNL